MSKTLLVCSGGGHLKQLFTLADRIGIAPEDQFWVTFDNGLSRSLLADRAAIFTHFAAPRDAMNIIRMRALASLLLAHTPFDRAISTGSSPAVSFLPVAVRKGIPSFYIESAARAIGPSLSGRIIARNSAISTFTQYPTWSNERWQYRGAIFDAFAPNTEVTPRAPKRAVVSIGTQDGYPFDRLFASLAPLVADYDEVLWQTGAHDVSKFGITNARSTVPHAELSAAIAEADVVVTHAGVGAALTAIEAGKVPVLVPRLAQYREHVDDHQTQIATELTRRGLGLIAQADELSSIHLERAASLSTRRVEAPAFILDRHSPVPAPRVESPARRGTMFLHRIPAPEERSA